MNEISELLDEYLSWPAALKSQGEYQEGLCTTFEET